MVWGFAAGRTGVLHKIEEEPNTVNHAHVTLSWYVFSATPRIYLTIWERKLVRKQENRDQV